MLGGTFEYLMTSLPNLPFQKTEEAKERVLHLLQKYGGNAATGWSPIEILDSEAEKLLAASSFSVFQKIDLKNIHEEAFRNNEIKVLSAFSKFAYDFKRDLFKWRISQDVGENISAKSNLEKIIGNGTPLQKEIKIIKYQWAKIEEFSVGHFADLEALVTYKIKLLILLRWWSFNKEKGLVKFNEMTAKE